MRGNSNQQAYDRGITIFSPDGRLYQVEYAREAVSRGTAVVGVRTTHGVVLAADKHLRSPLIEADSVEKLHEIDTHIGVASAGHAADARQLVDVARRAAQGNRLRYDEPIGVEALTTDISDYVQEYTQTGGARPFGVALLVGGIEGGRPRLFETDPSGTAYEWQATAIGGDGEEIRAYLADEYRADMDLDGGIDLAVEALAAPGDDGFSPEGIGLSTIDVETGRYRELDAARREQVLTDLDLLVDRPAS